MISYLKVDFPEIRRKNVRFFNLVHAHKPKFGLKFFFFLVAISDFLLAIFFSFLSALLISLSVTLHILFFSRESLVFIADKA